MFLLACNLTKNGVHFLSIGISSKKSTRKQRGLFDQLNHLKKVRGNNVDFSINKITSKKYVEMTWKCMEICRNLVLNVSRQCRRRIDVNWTWWDH